MRRIFLLIVLLCPFLFAGTANQHLMRLLKSRGTTPCATAGCTGTYDFCWTGDYSGSNVTACLNSGASTIVGTQSGGTIDSAYGVTGNGFYIDTTNDYISFAISDTTSPIADYEFNDSVGTYCADIYSQDNTATNQFVEVSESTFDWSNYLSGRIDANTDDVRIEHMGQGTELEDDGTDLVGTSGFVTVCVSYNYVDGINDQLATKVGGNAWQEPSTMPMNNLADGTYQMLIGERGRDVGQGGMYIDNFKFKASYKYAF